MLTPIFIYLLNSFSEINHNYGVCKQGSNSQYVMTCMRNPLPRHRDMLKTLLVLNQRKAFQLFTRIEAHSSIKIDIHTDTQPYIHTFSICYVQRKRGRERAGIQLTNHVFLANHAIGTRDCFIQEKEVEEKDKKTQPAIYITRDRTYLYQVRQERERCVAFSNNYREVLRKKLSFGGGGGEIK